VDHCWLCDQGVIYDGDFRETNRHHHNRSCG
jgi:hypothetical protein